jgi:flagellar hook-associated protein 3 FlgL
MRVTANTFPNTLVNQLSQLAVRQNRLQSQAATGQRVRLPEDDPTAMRRVLDLEGETSSLSQYQRNISTLKEYATASYNAMSALKKISDRAGEIATLADGTKSAEELKTYAVEINELISQGVQLANSKNRGDYLFAGTTSDQPPFVIDPLDANGQITGVTYQGNTTVPAGEIAEGTTITVHVPGANTAGTGAAGLLADSRTGADFFAHLISLRDHLQSGDTGSVASTDRGNLQKDEDNFLNQFGVNGVNQARLETANSIATQRSSSLGNLISKEADADLSQTLVRLSETQSAYQAALQSGATILNQSLLDYLK